MAEALGTAVLNLFVNDKGLVAGMAAAQAKARTKMGAMAGMAAAGAKAMVVPLVAIGAVSIHMAREFNGSMTKIQTLVGVSKAQVDEWRGTLLKLGPEVAKSPKELADALFFVTSAGFRGSEAIDILTTSAKASKVGLGETKVVADLVTSAMNSYGKGNLTASAATDTLVGMVRAGKAEASAFAPVLGAILPLASEMGVEFNEVGGSLAQMTRLGIPATRAATALQAVMSGLLKPTGAAEETMKKYGLSAAGLRKQLKEKGLISVLETVKKSTKGNSAEMAKIFPNIRALRGVLALVGKAGGSTAEVFDQVKNSTGSLGKAWDVVSKKDGFKMDQAMIKMQVSAIKLGDAIMPTVATIIQGIGMLADAFAKLPHSIRTGVVAFGALILVVGIGAKMWPALRLILIAVKFAIMGVAKALIFLAANPIILVIVLIAALVAGLIYAYQHNKRFAAAVDAAAKMIANAVKAAWNWIKSAMTGIVNAFKTVVNWLKGNWKTIALIISGPFAPLVALATDAFGIRSALVSAFTAVLNKVKAIWTAVVGATRSAAGRALGAAKAVGSAIVSGVQIALGKLSALGGWLISKVVSGINATLTMAWSMAKGIGSAIMNGIKAGLKSLWNSVKEAFVGMVEDIVAAGWSAIKPGSPSKLTAKLIGEPMMAGIAKGMMGKKKAVVFTITQIVKDAINAAKQNATSLAGDVGSTLVEAIDASTKRRLAVADKGPEADRIRSIEAQIEAEDARAKMEQLQGDIANAEDAGTRLEAQKALDRHLLELERDRLSTALDLHKQGVEDEAEARKAGLTQGITDLTDMLNRGAISQAEYTSRLAALIADKAPEYQKLGMLLGDAQARAYIDTYQALLAQAGLVQQTGSGVVHDLINPYTAAREELNEILKMLIGRATSTSSAGGKKITADEGKPIAAIKARIAAIKGLASGGMIGGALGNDRAGIFALSNGEGVMRRTAMEGMQRFFERGGGAQPVVIQIAPGGTIIGSGDERSLGRELARIVQPELARRVALSSS